MDTIPLPRLLIGYGILFGLPLSLFLFPRSAWTRRLTSAVGPALDTRLLTRGQCLWNAATYFVLGVAALVAAIATGTLAAWWFSPLDPPLPFLALGFAYFLLGLVGLGGAVYLLAKAPFRPKVLGLAHPSVDIRILKPYESADRSYTVLIGVTPDDEYYVLVPARAAPDQALEPRALGPFDGLEEAERTALAEAGHLGRNGV